MKTKTKRNVQKTLRVMDETVARVNVRRTLALIGERHDRR